MRQCRSVQELQTILPQIRRCGRRQTTNECNSSDVAEMVVPSGGAADFTEMAISGGGGAVVLVVCPGDAVDAKQPLVNP